MTFDEVILELYRLAETKKWGGKATDDALTAAIEGMDVDALLREQEAHRGEHLPGQGYGRVDGDGFGLDGQAHGRLACQYGESLRMLRRTKGRARGTNNFFQPNKPDISAKISSKVRR